MNNKCPKCGKEFDEINGLYVWCKSCDYIEDSTFEQITNSEDFIRNKKVLEE